MLTGIKDIAKYKLAVAADLASYSLPENEIKAINKRIILLNGWFCAFYLALVRRKHCVSTKNRVSNLKFVVISKKNEQMLVETQCLRLTDAK